MFRVIEPFDERVSHTCEHASTHAHTHARIRAHTHTQPEIYFKWKKDNIILRKPSSVASKLGSCGTKTSGVQKPGRNRSLGRVIDSP